MLAVFVNIAKAVGVERFSDRMTKKDIINIDNVWEVVPCYFLH